MPRHSSPALPHLLLPQLLGLAELPQRRRQRGQAGAGGLGQCPRTHERRLGASLGRRRLGGQQGADVLADLARGGAQGVGWGAGSAASSHGWRLARWHSSAGCAAETPPHPPWALLATGRATTGCNPRPCPAGPEHPPPARAAPRPAAPWPHPPAPAAPAPWRAWCPPRPASAAAAPAAAGRCRTAAAAPPPARLRRAGGAGSVAGLVAAAC